ncbi:lysophospholipid acyltransferase family protein [Coprobacter tertius]|uniref:Lysophospholipid acyltransferase family protein n=1 Tax=Coprobacter tertius TaxID=2944915 RepID=A0ABT1MGN1_9BACT|nr:lysophospholipid acyltransferase family protein [Coprobacter tertius]MCP9611793.1 lysophospholipid acyltransferase family protein [Coprobacter tertius]
MKKKFARFLLNLFGWKTVVNVPDLDKCVICVAPHTSNWDFILGKLAYISIGRQAGFMIKKEWFFFPLNLIFRSMGGIPVYRKKKTDLTDQVVDQFNKRDKFCIAITPEATRKRNDNWKKGFYYIALKANVPIILAYIDYKRKEIGLKKVFYPTGNIEPDMKIIKNAYDGVTALHPENFAK